MFLEICVPLITNQVYTGMYIIVCSFSLSVVLALKMPYVIFWYFLLVSFCTLLEVHGLQCIHAFVLCIYLFVHC